MTVRQLMEMPYENASPNGGRAAIRPGGPRPAEEARVVAEAQEGPGVALAGCPLMIDFPFRALLRSVEKPARREAEQRLVE
jgi:hypothetical protein